MSGWQVDGTYIHQLDALVPSLCSLARETGERSQLQLRSAGLRALSALVCILVFHGFLFSYSKPTLILLFFISHCSIICLETHDVITVASLHHGADLVHGRTFIHPIYI